MTHKSIIERAAESLMDHKPAPEPPQWCREFEEAWKACREQLEARVKAAGEVS